MWERLRDWIMDLVLGYFGIQRVPKEQKKKEQQAENARKMARKKQKEEWEQERSEWEDASIDEKLEKVLSRYPDNDTD